MAWWIWILIAFALLAIEFVSTTAHIGLFAVGAVTVALLVALGVKVPMWGELLIFTAVSLVALFFLRPVIVKRLKLHSNRRVDDFIGEQATALADIAPAGLGKAELRGTTWSARNVGTSTLTRGQLCVVDRVDGLVLYIRAS